MRIPCVMADYPKAMAALSVLSNVNKLSVRIKNTSRQDALGFFTASVQCVGVERVEGVVCVCVCVCVCVRARARARVRECV